MPLGQGVFVMSVRIPKALLEDPHRWADQALREADCKTARHASSAACRSTTKRCALNCLQLDSATIWSTGTLFDEI